MDGENPGMKRGDPKEREEEMKGKKEGAYSKSLPKALVLKTSMKTYSVRILQQNFCCSMLSSQSLRTSRK